MLWDTNLFLLGRVCLCVKEACIKACELHGSISKAAMTKRLTHHIQGNIQIPKCSCSPLALVASFYSNIVVCKKKIISELAHPVEQAEFILNPQLLSALAVFSLSGSSSYSVTEFEMAIC